MNPVLEMMSQLDASPSHASTREDDTARSTAEQSVADAVQDVNMSAAQEALSSESRRRSNIFGILHSETIAATATTTNDTASAGPTSPSCISVSPRIARMSVDSLVHRDGEGDGEGFLAVLRGGVGHHHDSAATTGDQPNGNGHVENGRQSLSPRKKSNASLPKRSDEMMLDEEDEPMPSSRRASLQIAEISENDNDQGKEQEGPRESEADEGEQLNGEGDIPEGDIPPSSDEEDEGVIDGAMDHERGDDDDEEDEEESSDDDDDDEGSIDLDQEDAVAGDSPVFLSMRNGPLGIPDLLLPPAGDVVRVKTEPEDHNQSQGGSSDVVVLGSHPPSAVVAPANSGPMENVPIEIGSSLPVEGTADGAPAEPAAEPTVNILVAKPKKKKARAKSPSPPPPPPPKMRATIRVVFNLFDDDEGPDGVRPQPAKEEVKEESAVPPESQGDVPMESKEPKEEDVVPMEKPVVPKPGEEPKFRVVNFKEASIAQGKVDTDYYVVNSGWNATESDDDDADDADDYMDGTGRKTKKKLRDLMTNATASSSTAGAHEATPSAPGILEAMMGGADAAELERLAAELDKKYSAKPGSKRKRPDPTDDYDYKDPFIDDSDLQMDEVMIMHRPAKEGFYVQKGAVELISDDEDGAKKSKGKKQTTLNFGKVTPRDSPGDSDIQPGEQTKKRKKMTLGLGFRPSKAGASSNIGPPKPGLSMAELAKGASHRTEKAQQSSRKTSVGTTVQDPVKETSPEVTVLADSEPANNPPLAPVVRPPLNLDEGLARLPEELRPLLLDVSRLNESLSDDDWKAIKDAKKFPEAFKPLIHTMGQKAVELGLIGDSLYDVLPFVIRYNRFTMKKYMLDKLKDYQLEYYQRTKSELISVLKDAIESSLPKQVSDFTASQEKYDAAIRAEEEAAKLEGREPAKLSIQQPFQRIRWSEDMKQVFYRLCKAADSAGKFEAAQAEVHQKPQHSLLYQRRNQLFAEIEPLFPKGWMSSSQLSRQMTGLKARYEKQGTHTAATTSDAEHASKRVR